MRELDGFMLHTKHRLITIVLMFGTGSILMFWVKLPGIDSFTVWLVLVCAYIVMRLVISDHRMFAGYGITPRLNHIAGKKIGYEYPLLCMGLFPKRLINIWLMYLGIGAINMLLGHGLPYVIQSSSTLQQALILMSHYISIAIIIGVLGAMHVWIMADRKWRWYISEDVLRRILALHKFDPIETERIVLEARAQNLLFKSPIRFKPPVRT